MKIKSLIADNKKVIVDVLFNVIAYSLPVFARQILVLPYLGRVMNEEGYGIVIAVISLITLISHMLGLTLNNIRLIHNSEYEEKNLEGDFKLLLHLACIIDIIIIAVALLFYIDIKSIADIIGIVVLSLLWLFREYYIVTFRIKLDYKRIFINNLLMLAGFVAGIVIYKLTDAWYMIYLTAYAFSLVYILKNSTLHKEKARLTPLFKKSVRDYGILTAANFTDTCLNNIDKLFIFPILGAGAVAVYFASTVYTKIVSMAVTPVSSVLLSYLSKMKNNVKSKFSAALISGIAVGAVGYAFCILFGRLILNILYPDYADEAIVYMYITSATSMLVLIRSLLRPFLLKFCKMVWQLIIDATGAVIYFVIAGIFIGELQIWAVCYAVFFATLFKLCTMIIVYAVSSKKNLEAGD